MKKEFKYLCGVGFVLSATGILVQDALALGESPTQPVLLQSESENSFS